MLILKHLKIKGKLWNMLAKEKMAANFIENGIFADSKI